MSKADEIVAERGATHGDYSEMSSTVQTIKQAMRRGSSWNNMGPGQQEALELIATKIGRIVTGDSACRDHWDDIEGYAKLGLRCTRVTNNNETE